MRLLSVLLLLSLALPASADLPKPPCPSPKGESCVASPKEQKQARKAFQRGVKLQQRDRLEEAFDEFSTAAGLVPDNVEYLTAREIIRQQLVSEALKRGNQFALSRQQVQALAEYRTALELDPKNEFALERMRDALGAPPAEERLGVRLVASADEIQLQPRAGTADFHYRGELRGLAEAIGAAFKVSIFFEDSFPSKRVRVDLTGVDFKKAMEIAGKVGKFFWAPMSETQILVANDTPDNRRRYERMSLRSFYISGTTSPQSLNEIMGMLRALFDIRMISAQPNRSLLTMRAPKDTVDAAARFLEALSAGPPQVMLDIRVFEINKNTLRDLGISLPLQYNLLNLSTILAALQNQPNLQDLINQLFTSGGINQANTQAIAGLLAQLQNQANSILANPVATFGGGSTLMGLTIPTSSITAVFNETTVKTLEHVSLRAAQGSAANLLIGTRYPVLNATFSPIFNSAQIAKVIGNLSFQPAFPSFSYEDIGLTLKATPQVHADREITLNMEMHLRNLAGQSFNGVPVIINREYQGTIALKNGETAVMAGYVTESEQRTLHGPPGIGQLPVIGRLLDEERKETVYGEILVLVTPHIIDSPQRGNLEVWLSK